MGSVLMRLQLRDYQQAAIDGLYDYWAAGRGNHPIIVAPTGAGKSLIIAKLIEDALEFPETRIMVLAHVKELLEQNARELLQLLPGADVGFYSASIGQKRLDRRVTFAGIQSVWQRAFDIVPPPDLVLIDECHLVPKDSATRYRKFIADLQVCNPAVKIVGLTATPYRLDSGYLHKGGGALFDGIAYDIPIGLLIERGYLVPVVSRSSANNIDLTGVRMRGGEFVESDLAAAASDPELVRRTVAEIVERGAEHRAWLVFACGIEHARLIRSAMADHGVEAEVVTGADSKADRERVIEDFRARRLRCLINVNVLTTGFNVPHVDLVALVRATASPGLYVQMVGRGTRTAPGKTDCLVLDFGQNVERHGFIDAVRPRAKGAGGDDGGGDAPVKVCSRCRTVNPIAARVCIECGAEFPPPPPRHGPVAYQGALLSSQVQAEWVEVADVFYARHRKEGKPDSIKVTYQTGLTFVSEWLCPDHGGYATSKYRARMPFLGATALTTADALAECEEWKWPYRIKIKPSASNSRFMEILQFDYSQPNPAQVQRAKNVGGEIYDFGFDIPF
jgi:DNA repair protein RadD